jgi:hypothetical protein
VSRRRACLGAAALVLTALAACTQGEIQRVAPTCRNTNTLVLEAQSVPGAELVPCVGLLPAGWDVETVTIESGRTRFALRSDRAGDQAVVVSLVPRCDISGATEIASDEEGTRRFEKVESVTPGFTGVRYYTFRGGCVTYRFRFAEEGRALINEASLALTFVPRRAVSNEVARRTGGRERL